MLTDVNGKSVTDIKSLNALSKMLMGECLWCTRTFLLALSLFFLAPRDPMAASSLPGTSTYLGQLSVTIRKRGEGKSEDGGSFISMLLQLSVCCCSWRRN